MIGVTVEYEILGNSMQAKVDIEVDEPMKRLEPEIVGALGEQTGATWGHARIDGTRGRSTALFAPTWEELQAKVDGAINEAVESLKGAIHEHRKAVAGKPANEVREYHV